MTAPTKQTRTDTYTRDGYRCVMCGGVDPLTFQHRRAVGTRGSKGILPPPVDGLTLCAVCNQRCEADMQDSALSHGWKVRSWVKSPERVPVYYPGELGWFRLEGVTRVRISSAVAMEMGCSVYGDEWMRWQAHRMFGADGRGMR
ncbi:hypothetical protein [Microbacterium sp. 69-10]|uniref:hypothetical protein n=1 Tax=Microbacterium sp. 69-10 TaxID=1895783 RepID=UPI0025F2DFCC|nr:hypothetical protein [Microbacterium sp. 69-10]